MQQTARKPHQLAWRTYTENLVPVLALMAVQILVRVIAFAPFIAAFVTGKFLSFNPEHALAYGLVFSLPLYALIVMPFRFQAKARMAQLYGLDYDSRINFGNFARWLIAAMVRLAIVLPALLPLFAFSYLFYYYMRVPGFNESLLFIHQIGAALGGTYPMGILIIGLIGILSLLLAAWGWLRGLAFEHQDVLSQGIAVSLKKANQRFKEQKKVLFQTVRKNKLLFLPAFLGVLAVLVVQVLNMPLMGSLVYDFLIAVSVFLTMNFPQGTLFILLVVLLVLWLPVLPLRKLALSAVLIEEPEHSREA